MTDKVGTKTGKQTQAGRDVYVTPEGENVSEKSTTFKYKGKWINVPSIHDGRRYDDATLKLMLEAEIIEPTSSHKNREDAEKAAKARSDNLKFNKGGTPMKDQMELFEDGGLKDEGGMIDKESGNEVPVGGTRKGVRDDIPAMVSEGEFVFPEDVVRYIGLDKLMQLRQKAKVGLKRMEEMGQMGNSDEATVPDDMPMDAPDLVIVAGEAPKEMAEGGAVVGGVEQTAAPRRLTPEVQQPERKQVSFKQLMGKNSVEFKQYRNAQGASLLIPFVGGNPIYPIPSGYTLYDASTGTADPTSPEGQADAIATEVSTAINRATGNDRDDDGPAPVPQSAFQKAGSWDMDTSGKDGKALQMWIDEATKYTNGTSTVVTGVAAAFGLAPLVMYGVARDKKDILKDIDAKIAQARKTDMAGQVAALEAIKKDLTEKNTGISSALSSLATTVSDLFNLSNEQKEAAVTTASKVTELEDSIAEQTPAAFTPDVAKDTATPAVDEGFQQDQASQTLAAFTPTVSGPAAAEAQFGAPLGDPLGGTPPAVDELVFTPSLPVPTPTATPSPFAAGQQGATTAAPFLADPRLMQAAGVTGGYDEQPIVQGTKLQGMENAPIVYGKPSPTAAKVEVTPYEGSVQQAAALNVAEQMRRMTEERAKQRLEVIDPEFTAGIPVPDFDPRGPNQIPTVEQKQSSLRPVPAPVGPTGSYDEVPSLVRPATAATAATAATVSDPYGIGAYGEFGSTQEGGFGTPLVDELISKPKSTAAPTAKAAPKAVAKPAPKAVAKPALKPAPKPAPVRNEKSTRLDSSNPNTSSNITNHLSKVEKESLNANPALAGHYTATANRRANEAASGDTSNTDAANEASDNKIVCTAMNNSYGFGSYRQAIWLSYSKDHLTKEHELGYHTLFLPLVDLAYNKNNKFIRKALEHIARHRTADIRASMQNKKRDTLGRIYRSILEPLVYTVGKFRTITGI